jgi:adenylate cyclase
LTDQGGHTFRYVQAAAVIGASANEQTPAAKLASPDVFKDKIVLIGTVSAGTYDLRATPLSIACPGVDVQATAMANLIHGQSVHPAGLLVQALVTILSAMMAAIGAGVPRRVVTKLAISGGAVIAPLLLAGLLFIGSTIIWLPAAAPMQAGLIALVGAFAYSYLIEDRQRRFFIRALSQYVSPHVADELSRNRSLLKIGSERREMTVMFTDIAGFTDLSEHLEPEQLGELLNYYLDEMSSVVLSVDGTLDKYVGDAIVTFWNAPLTQVDHASRACKAALAMRQREQDISETLNSMGGRGMYTRIGINSGTMAVGNMGSRRKFNYSVLGDAVNLGSRLESANKMYGTRILMSQSTADLVRGEFQIRKIDVLRVKGKLRPVAVYELISEGPRDPNATKLVHLYEYAFERYQAQDWDTAEQYLLEIATKFPDDTPSKVLSGRVQAYRKSPPPPGWDGVYVALDK